MVFDASSAPRWRTGVVTAVSFFFSTATPMLWLRRATAASWSVG